jgi:tripartite-type tricarboxylate transporter receptor subunit TctC
MPKALVARLNAEMVKAVASPTFREKALAIGSEPISSTPEQFGAFIRSEYAKWGEVIRRSGARID